MANKIIEVAPGDVVTFVIDGKAYGVAAVNARGTGYEFVGAGVTIDKGADAADGGYNWDRWTYPSGFAATGAVTIPEAANQDPEVVAEAYRIQRAGR